MYKISIAKPPCTPIREALTSLGFEVRNPDKAWGANIERINTYGVMPNGRRCEDGWWPEPDSKDPAPSRMQADVYVKRYDNARWTEYLLLRSKRFRLISRPMDSRNAKWAMPHGTMPNGWMDNRDGECSKAELPKEDQRGGVDPWRGLRNRFVGDQRPSRDVIRRERRESRRRKRNRTRRR